MIEPDFVFPVSFPTIPFPWAFFSSFLASTRFLLPQAKTVKIIGMEATRAGLFAGPNCIRSQSGTWALQEIRFFFFGGNLLKPDNFINALVSAELPDWTVELRNILDFTLAEHSPAILVEVIIKKIRIDLSPEEKYHRGACVETKWRFSHCLSLIFMFLLRRRVSPISVNNRWGTFSDLSTGQKLKINLEDSSARKDKSVFVIK